MSRSSFALATFGRCVCGLNLAWHRTRDNRQLTCLGARHAYETFQARRRASQSLAVPFHRPHGSREIRSEKV